MTLASAYSSGVPKLVLGTYQIDSPAGTTMDYTIFAVNASKTATAFGITYTVGASTSINSLKLCYLTIDKNINAMSTFNDGYFHIMVGAASKHVIM